MTDKLLYFHMRGRAEAIRMLYAVTGKEFEDSRLSFGEFAAVKKEQPMGQLPTLTTSEGGVLIESAVIARHVARKLGLAGTSAWEESLHDLVVESSKECINEYVTFCAWKTFKLKPVPENSEEILQHAKDKWICVINYIQSIAERNGNKYIIGDELGLAELWLYTGLEFSKFACPDAMTLTPWTKQFSERVAADPKLARYLADRPESNL